MSVRLVQMSTGGIWNLWFAYLVLKAVLWGHYGKSLRG